MPRVDGRVPRRSTSTTVPTTPPAGNTGTGGGGRGGFGGGGGGGLGAAAGAFQAQFQACLPPSYQAYEAQVVVPTQTIEQVINPPSTNTQTSSYTVAGVDPSSPNTGLITKAQVVKGNWFSSKPADQILVSTAYASTKSIKVGQSLTIDKTSYSVVGLVNPTLTGDTSDIYFDLATLQSSSSNSGRINEVLVQVNKPSDVNTVAARHQEGAPWRGGAHRPSRWPIRSPAACPTHILGRNLGGALAVIVLLAAFLIAALLTMSSIAKRSARSARCGPIGWS